MRELTEREEVKKNVILKQCFNCIVENGIEKTSIKIISEATGMTASSLYYWFKDKNEIVLDATEYGVRKIVDKLFGYAMKNINDVQNMCEEFPHVVEKYHAELRAIFQIATSPQYGKNIIELSDGFSALYDIYAMRLAKQIEMDYDRTREFVNLFVSSIVDCVTWNEWDKLKKESKFILQLLLEDK